MKTLDEVIETAPYVGTEWTNNALHYLREYRETKKHLACLDDAEIRGDNTQVVNNPPLDWDELLTMEGKPVWVEYLMDGATYDDAEWCIVKDVNDDVMHDTEGYGYGRVNKYGDGYGVGWQAYRKERL